ncbi:MAG TPA: methyltransferase domain-containing protein [Planktothrix sp.]|jgi:SAM-dependent methyltransferase
MESEILASRALAMVGETPTGEALTKSASALAESVISELSGANKSIQTADSATNAVWEPTASQWKRINAQLKSTRDWHDHVLANDFSRYMYVATQSDERVAYTEARRLPALRDVVKGDALKVVEIGGSTDITVPRVLDSRLSQYLTMDLNENPILSEEWTRLMNKYGIATTNKFRVGASATSLPLASESQDLVCAYGCPPLCFWNNLPTITKRQAVAEAARVLKPGGQLLLHSYPTKAEAIGNELLSKHFNSMYVHFPNESDLSRIDEFGAIYKHHQTDRDLYRTMIATKPL